MGTPEFAVASLKAIYEAGYPVVAVITAPDKPAGRGMHLQQSAVKTYALEKNIPVLQPEKLKNPAFLEQLKSYNAHLQIVVAFRMLPEIVWNMPPMGTINLHGSLLPQYRGAAPINWAIINGETITGVTTFKLQHEIDTGNVLLQKSIPISEEDTAGTLHDTMKEVGAQVLVRTIEGLMEGNIDEQEQTTHHQNSESEHNKQPSQAGDLSSIVNGLQSLKHAPKIFTETCCIDWTKNCETIYNLIRGLSPLPGAFTQLNGKILKVYAAQKEIANHSTKAGTYETDRKSFLKFSCENGFIQVTDVQPEGKRRMKVEEFLRGFRE